MSQSEYKQIKPNDWKALRQAARRCDERLANLEGYSNGSKRYNDLYMQGNRIFNGPIQQNVADGNEFITKYYLATYDASKAMQDQQQVSTSQSASVAAAEGTLVRVPSDEIVIVDDYDVPLPEPYGELCYKLDLLNSTSAPVNPVEGYDTTYYIMTMMFTLQGYFEYDNRQPGSINILLPEGFWHISTALEDSYTPVVCQSEWSQRMVASPATWMLQKTQLGQMSTYYDWPFLRISPISLDKDYDGSFYPTQPNWIGASGELTIGWWSMYAATIDNPVWYNVAGHVSIPVGTKLA